VYSVVFVVVLAARSLSLEIVLDYLKERRQNDKSSLELLPPVGPVEQFLQPLVFLHRPREHLTHPGHQKQISKRRLRGDVKAQPLVNLAAIIRARHVIEQKPARNDVFRLRRRRRRRRRRRPPTASQSLLNHVTPEIPELKQSAQDEPNRHLPLPRTRIPRMVNKIRHQTSERPIIPAVPN
tara:strand:- start:202 stop:744 length:543 start_codon:yes stop_codon:yes gene_type:complete